jgi:hypothetical protein
MCMRLPRRKLLEGQNVWNEQKDSDRAERNMNLPFPVNINNSRLGFHFPKGREAPPKPREDQARSKKEAVCHGAQ